MTDRQMNELDQRDMDLELSDWAQTDARRRLLAAVQGLRS